MLATDDASCHNSSYSIGVSEHSSVDPRRAAEIDQMIESGNWDGVVAVSARYADVDDAIESSTVQSRSGSPMKVVARSSSEESRTSKNEESSIASVSVENADASSTADTTQSGSQTTDADRTSWTSGGTSYTGTYSGTETIDKEDYSEMDSSTYTSHASPSVTSTVTGSVTSSFASRGGIASSTVSYATANTEEEKQMKAYRAEVEALVRRVVPGKNSFIL